MKKTTCSPAAGKAKRYLTLQQKFIITLCTAVIFVAAVLGFYLYHNQSRQLVEKNTTAGLVLAEQVTGSFNFLFSEIFDTTSFVFLEREVRDMLEEYKGYNYPPVVDNKNLETTLSSLVVTKSYIATFIIYNDKGMPLFHVVTDNTSGPRVAESEKELSILRIANEKNGQPVWYGVDPHESIFFQSNRQQKVAMCRALKDRNLNAIVGYIVVSVNTRDVQKKCVNFPIDESAFLQVETPEGFPVYQSSTQNSAAIEYLAQNQGDFASTQRTPVNGQDTIIVRSVSGETGWCTTYLFPAVELRNEIQLVLVYIVLLILLCLLCALPLAIIISKHLTAPIDQLLASMRAFQGGDFSSHIDMPRGDEFGTIADAFNDMVSAINELVKKNYVLQLKEREAEINALQAQINPHFLYNTLEMIYWEAEQNGQKELGKMVLSLSKMFRLSLNKGALTTTVASEVEFITHYLALQNIRFGTRLAYTIVCQPEARDCLVPKLILQPVVENAILHGFADKAQGCRLDVEVWREGNQIWYRVRDNGAGMDEAEVQRYLQTAHTPGSISLSRGYALSNIVDRLALLYGQDYDLEIESAPGQGTTVKIRLNILENKIEFKPEVDPDAG